MDMENLVFERKEADTANAVPLCAVNCLNLGRYGIRGLQYDSKIEFAPIRRALVEKIRHCRIQKRKGEKPGEQYIATLWVRLTEEEAALFGSSWISFLLKPDGQSGGWMFAKGASIQRPGSEVYGEPIDLELRFTETPFAFDFCSEPYRRATEFFAFLSALQPAPQADQQSREELESAWNLYIKALREISRRKTLLFKVLEAEAPRIDERNGRTLVDILFDKECFVPENCEEIETVISKEDFQPDRFGTLRQKMRDATDGEEFETYEAEQKPVLVAQLKNESAQKTEARGRPFGRLVAIDLSKGRMTFSLGGREGEEEDDEADPARLPQPGEYLAPRRAGDFAQVNRMAYAFDQLKAGKLPNSYLAASLFDAKLARNAQVPLEHSDAYALVKRRLLRPLNDEQLKAVVKALFAPDLALIQGPPGTGKTTVIAEIIHQVLADNPRARILLTSQSHLAVDNALERLKGDRNMRPIRTASRESRRSLEDEGRLFTEDLIEEWIAKADSTERWTKDDNAVARDFSKRLDNLASRSPLDADASRFIDKARAALPRADREMLWESYLRGVNVVAATCSECGRPDFRKRWRPEGGFDLVIVDEVSKAAPPELLVPLVHAKKAILIGDHRQLPPMIEEKLLEERLVEAGAEDLERRLDAMRISLFERLFGGADGTIKETLRAQYRMHEGIQKVIERFYADDGGLRLGLAKERMDAPDLREPESRHHGLRFGTFLSERDHALWIDVDGTERKEKTSYYNEEEIEAVIGTLRVLRAAPGWGAFASSGAANPEIGVISFYGSQTRRLQERIKAEFGDGGIACRVKPVDKFQGMERDIVIVSLVRSSRFEDETGRLSRNTRIGFAQDYRRINVAFSRAKRLLVIVGSRGHFCRGEEGLSSRYYREIWEGIDARSGVRGAEMLMASLEAEGLA